MILSRLTWPEVGELSRDIVVVIPTGSLEQHGRHLPLFTDSILAIAVAEAVERAIPEKVLLTPTLWLGASGHHLAFPGSLSHDFAGYISAIQSVVNSLWPHGFRKFYVLNGHGGNTEPNGIALREMKQRYPTGVFGHRGYFSFIEPEVLETLKGPRKGIAHACEAETSLMLHVAPDLVRTEFLRDDGLVSEPPVLGVIHTFDEMTEAGSLGHATFADPATGARLFESAVLGVTRELATIAEGYVLRADF